MSDCYKFVGVLNLFDIYPDFLIPIYQKEDELFFHNGDKNQIYNFDLISESVKERVIFIESKSAQFVNNSDREYFFVHDTPVYAFQKAADEIFCSDLEDMIQYLNQFITSDVILQKQIKRFIDENTFEYYIPIFYKDFPKQTSFHQFSEMHERKMEVLKSIDILPTYMPFMSPEISLFALSKIFAHNMRGNQLFNDNIIENMELKKKYGFHVDVKPYMHGRLNMLNKDNQIDDICCKLYHMDYNTRRVNNIFTINADFTRLKEGFDTIIKIETYDSPFYELCIKCQNAVINKDENELILLINKNYQLFLLLRKRGLLDDYVTEYVRDHINEVSFEFF